MSDNAQNEDNNWGTAGGAAASDELIQRIGQVTRMLRDSMRELGLDKEIEKAAQAIPDARDRLGYIASMTEQAGERALNAVDRAQPLQDALAKGAADLDKRWQEWFANPLDWTRPRRWCRKPAAIWSRCPSTPRPPRPS